MCFTVGSKQGAEVTFGIDLHLNNSSLELYFEKMPDLIEKIIYGMISCTNSIIIQHQKFDMDFIFYFCDMLLAVNKLIKFEQFVCYLVEFHFH